MTQNIEQRTAVAVKKYEGAAAVVGDLSNTDSTVDTPVGQRESFPKLSRKHKEDRDRREVEHQTDQVTRQNDFQTRFSASQQPLPWQAGLPISDPLQRYYVGTQGNQDYKEYLADPEKLPFTTGSSIAEDIANKHWLENGVPSLLVVEKINKVETGMATGSRKPVAGTLDEYNSGTIAIDGHDSLRVNDYPKAGASSLFMMRTPPLTAVIKSLDIQNRVVEFVEDIPASEIAAHGSKQAPYFIGWRNFQNLRAEDYDNQQKAINACPKGGSVELANETLTESIIIDKPIHVNGYGQSNPIYGRSNDLCLKMGVPDTPMFLLRPQDGGASGDYFPGQYAIIGVTFSDFKAVGYGSRRNNFIDVEQVNNGNYHVRGVEHRGIVTDNFDVTFNYQGRCYLIDFYGGSVLASNVGFRNTFQYEAGGQCRVFGTDFIGNDLAMDLQSGSFDLSLFGASVSENRGGIKMRHTNPFRSSGCVYEGNKSTDPNHVNASLFIENTGSNPQTHAFKSIVGNKFLGSEYDIWIDDNQAGWESISMPGVIESNEFQGKVRLDQAIQKNMKFGVNGILNESNIIGLSPLIDARISDWSAVNQVSQAFPVSTNSLGSGNNVFYFGSLSHGKKVTFFKGYRASYTDSGTASDNAGLELQYYDGSSWVTIKNLYGKGNFGPISFQNTTGATVPIRAFANDGGTGKKYMVSMLVSIV